MIYVIQAGDVGPVKIGFSQTRKSIRGRLASLQTANAERLRLLAVMEGERDLEKALHWRFRQKRLNGEWFRCSETDIAFLVAAQNFKVKYANETWSEINKRDALHDHCFRPSGDVLLFLSGENLEGCAKCGWPHDEHPDHPSRKSRFALVQLRKRPGALTVQNCKDLKLTESDFAYFRATHRRVLS